MCVCVLLHVKSIRMLKQTVIAQASRIMLNCLFSYSYRHVKCVHNTLNLQTWTIRVAASQTRKGARRLGGKYFRSRAHKNIIR